jgi:hypothetical protein
MRCTVIGCTAAVGGGDGASRFDSNWSPLWMARLPSVLRPSMKYVKPGHAAPDHQRLTAQLTRLQVYCMEIAFVLHRELRLVRTEYIRVAGLHPSAVATVRPAVSRGDQQQLRDRVAMPPAVLQLLCGGASNLVYCFG